MRIPLLSAPILLSLTCLAQRPTINQGRCEEFNAEQQRRELLRLDYTIEVNFPEFVHLQADFPLPVVAEIAAGKTRERADAPIR